MPVLAGPTAGRLRQSKGAGCHDVRNGADGGHGSVYRNTTMSAMIVCIAGNRNFTSGRLETR